MNKKINKRRVSIYSVIAVFYIFEVIIGFAIYSFQKKKYFQDVDNQMTNNLQTLINIIQIQNKNLQENNEIAINSFNYFVNINKQKFNFTNDIENIEAINFQTGLEEKIGVEKWYFDNQNIVNNYSLFNSIAISLKNDLFIAQKNSTGYITIYSSNKDFDNYQFPLTERFIFTIENGEYAKEILKIKDKKYYISAVPLYIKARIEGFLMAVKEVDFAENLSDIVNSQSYINKGYPILMETDGFLTLHPSLQNSKISNTDLYKKIIEIENVQVPQKIIYKWPENEKGEKKQLLIKYIPESQQFVGITYFVEDFYFYLNRLKIIIIMTMLIAGALITVLIIHLSNIFLKINELLTIFINKLSQGDLELTDKNLSALPNEAQKLYEKFKKLEDFSCALANENYQYEYELWSNNDETGKNFKLLTNHLSKLMEDEVKKAEEQKKVAWLNEGISQFIEILKYQVIEIKDLTYKIISHLVEYINANQGAFFIMVNEENEQYLELYSAYSMHKSKLIERKIPLGVGLVGRVVAEKKLLHITEIPSNYTPISTSLGEGIPKSIVIVPLLFNEQIIGVLEINSFKKIDDLHIQFIEKISENISANLAMWQANQRTANLLSQSENQTKLMLEQRQKLEKNLSELEKLKELSEQKETEFTSIIKAIDTTALLVEFDIKGNIINVNNKFLEIFKKRKEELIGKHHKIITSFDTKSTDYIFFWKDLTDGKNKRIIESFTIEDQTIWLSESFIPITDKDDKVVKIFNIAIDITENKLLEKQLREQVKEISKEARNVRKEERKIKQEREEFLEKENSYLSAIKSLDSILARFEISLEGNITFCNKLFSEILQIDSKVIMGKNINEYITREDREKFYAVMELVKKGDLYKGSINFLDFKSEIIKTNYVISPVFSLQNTVSKFIILIINIK